MTRDSELEREREKERCTLLKMAYSIRQDAFNGFQRESERKRNMLENLEQINKSY